jgi:hypothetical protein
VQQPLSAEAMQRCTTFESFIRRTTKADEARASKEYNGMLATPAATRMTVKSVRQLQTLIATEIGDKAPAGIVRDCGIPAAWRLRAFGREQAPPGVEPSFAEAAPISHGAWASERPNYQPGRTAPNIWRL